MKLIEDTTLGKVAKVINHFTNFFYCIWKYTILKISMFSIVFFLGLNILIYTQGDLNELKNFSSISQLASLLYFVYIILRASFINLDFDSLNKILSLVIFSIVLAFKDVRILDIYPLAWKLSIIDYFLELLFYRLFLKKMIEQEKYR